MRVSVFGGQSVGDSILLTKIKNSFDTVEHLGKCVDLSKVVVENENLIIILNSLIFNLNLEIIKKSILQNNQTPLVVVNRVNTFGAVSFGDYLKINDIFINKIYLFSGLFYIPKQYMQSTIGQVFKLIDKNTLRTFIINPKKRGKNDY